jgi:hypothetical protein
VKRNESLKTRALIGYKSDSVEEKVNDFSTQEVIAAGIDVGCVFLSTDEVFRVEEFLVGTVADLINAGRFKIDVDSTGNKFASLYVINTQ